MATWKKIITAADGADALSDVDTSSSTPSNNDVLKWNGSNWVPALYNENLTYHSVSLVATPAGPIAIGSGQWLADGELSFELNIDNGTASAGYVEENGNNAGFPGSNQEPFTAFNGGDGNDATCDNTNAIDYPTGAGGTSTSYGWNYQFTSVVPLLTNQSDYVYFNNYLYFGVVTVADTAPSEAAIEAFSGSGKQLSNNAGQGNSSSSPKSLASITTGVGDYVCIAVPKRIGETVGLQFKDGGSGFALSLSTNSPFDVTITNADGLGEVYSVYLSSASNVGEGAAFDLQSYV